MWNYKDSKSSVLKSLPIVTGASVLKEGSLLVASLEGGVQKVQPCSAAGSLIVAGFSQLDNESLTENVVVETVTVPAVAPYTVQLAHGNIKAHVDATANKEEAKAVRVVAGTALTQSVDGTPAAGEFDIAATTGIVTFNAAEAGLAITITYRYSMLAEEAARFFPGERSPNNKGGDIFKQASVMAGHGVIYTYEFEADKDYSGAPDLRTGAGGRITVGGGGTQIAASMVRVIKLPTVGDGTLGLAFNIVL